MTNAAVAAPRLHAMRIAPTLFLWRINVFELEERGFKLTQDGETLVVQPYQKLTRQDLALLAYTPASVQ
jgi:hypothetical protein